MTEDGMVGWHHRLDGREFEQVLGDGEAQGSLACCGPLGHEGSDTTERLNINNTRQGEPRGAARGPQALASSHVSHARAARPPAP